MWNTHNQRWLLSYEVQKIICMEHSHLFAIQEDFDNFQTDGNRILHSNQYLALLYHMRSTNCFYNWIMSSGLIYSLACGYQCFGGTYHIHLLSPKTEPTFKLETIRLSETPTTTYRTIWCHSQQNCKSQPPCFLWTIT